MISLSAANTQPQESAAAKQEIESRKIAGTLWTLPAEERNALYAAGYPGPQVRGGVTVKFDDSPPAPATQEASVSTQPASWPPTKEEADKKPSHILQAEALAELDRRRQAMQAEGTPNPAYFHLTSRGLQEARPPEPLDLTEIPLEDHAAAQAFHQGTGAQAFTTRRWLDYAAKHVPLGEDEAWDILNRQYGQGAGPLVADAQEAFHHTDFSAAIKRFIERHKLENDAPTLAALAEWYRAREGK